jgi:hypothetical protein
MAEGLQPNELTEEELGALKAFIAREILTNAQDAFAVVGSKGASTLGGSPFSVVAVATVIGKSEGVVRVTLLKDLDHTIDGITLTYWTMEAVRVPGGLKVKVAVETSDKEGITFILEGTVGGDQGAK